MAVTVGHLYEVSIKAVNQGVNIYNVFQYEALVGDASSDGADVSESWWNHVKGVWRALVVGGAGMQFLSVTTQDLSEPTGLYGSFAVPTGERQGTRTAPPQAELTPSFAAVGVRLTVGTRATRPGQKRLAGLVEEDLFGQAVHSGIISLVNAWADVVTEDMILGAPSALVTLRPVVVRRDVAGAPVTHQPVTGYLVNPFVTTQVSRKVGRGE